MHPSTMVDCNGTSVEGVNPTSKDQSSQLMKGAVSPAVDHKRPVVHENTLSHSSHEVQGR